jgi:hypothetical protein
MDKWLIRHLEETGAMAPGGIGRGARVRNCKNCGAPTFQGLDADMMAATAITDLAPLDAFGELVALTGGLATYSLRFEGGRYELDYRYIEEIRGSPPGTSHIDVVAEHRCGVRIPAGRLTDLAARRKAKPWQESDEPPF